MSKFTAPGLHLISLKPLGICPGRAVLADEISCLTRYDSLAVAAPVFGAVFVVPLRFHTAPVAMSLNTSSDLRPNSFARIFAKKSFIFWKILLDLLVSLPRRSFIKSLKALDSSSVCLKSCSSIARSSAWTAILRATS